MGNNTPGRRPSYFRDTDRGLPGRPLTESTDLGNPHTLIFPPEIGPYCLLYHTLALLARTGGEGADVVPVTVKQLREIVPRSEKWIYRALGLLGAYEFVFSTPAPPHLVAQGCHRVFRLRVPTPGTVATHPPPAPVKRSDRV